MKPLREWRTERLLGIRELAERAGVTKKTLIDLEYGRRLAHFATIRSISEALGVDAREVTEFAAVLDERGKDAA